jgi:hypothetical protein
MFFDQLKAFIKDPEKTFYDGKDADEVVLYVIRKSLLTVIPALLAFGALVIIPIFLVPFAAIENAKIGYVFSPSFITAITAFWYLVTFGFGFQIFVNWYFNVFIITNKKIVDVDVAGLLYKNISEASLRNIEDTTSNVRGTLGTIFNVGDMYVQTAAEAREFEFTSIDNPSHIRDILSDMVADIKQHGNN